MKTRGIRNKNPFNIVRSPNSWQGKLKRSKDDKFEQFISMDYGLRAGILLLLNGYLRKEICTIPAIINKFAPCSENQTDRYIDFVVKSTNLTSEKIITLNDDSFFLLCCSICWYESKFVLTRDRFNYIVKRFRLY